jgi:hypothetical protein
VTYEFINLVVFKDHCIIFILSDLGKETLVFFMRFTFISINFLIYLSFSEEFPTLLKINLIGSILWQHKEKLAVYCRVSRITFEPKSNSYKDIDASITCQVKDQVSQKLELLT